MRKLGIYIAVFVSIFIVGFYCGYKTNNPVPPQPVNYDSIQSIYMDSIHYRDSIIGVISFQKDSIYYLLNLKKKEYKKNISSYEKEINHIRNGSNDSSFIRIANRYRQH